MAEFFSIITSTGLAKLASLPVGNTLTLTHMAFGNSTLTPYEDQTALNSEQYRCALTKVANIDNEPDCIVAEAIITAEHGGFWIREVGIFDSDGDLFAVGKYPATYKPISEEGTVKELGVRMILRVSNASSTIVTYNNGIMDGAANTDLSNLTFQGQKKFDDKADLDSPNFVGEPSAPTAEPGTNSDQLATTAFVVNAIANAVSNAISSLVDSSPEALDTLNELAQALGDDPNFATTIANQLGLKANIASPNFTGVPTAPTANAGVSTTQIATTAFVANAIAKAVTDAINSLVGKTPDDLNTLEKIAGAIGNDADFVTTIQKAIAQKASKNGDTIVVAGKDPTGAFEVRNIKTQTNDPGAGTTLATGNVLLIYEE